MAGIVSTTLSMVKDKLKRVKKDMVVFTSFNGHYSDSPKYISEKIHELCPELELAWLVDEKFKALVPHYARAIDINSSEAKEYRVRARAIVDNVYGEHEYTQTTKGAFPALRRKMFSWLRKKNSQRVFTTWHGTPLKRMGRDQIGAEVYGFSCPNTTMILGNKFTLDIMNHLTFEKLKMELLGCPRNDLLFIDDEQKRQIKERLGLPLDKKIILFAPTFRTNGSDILDKNIERSGLGQINQIDFDCLFDTLSKKFGGDFAFVGRFHYHVERAIDFDALGKKYPNKFINGNLHDDMAEYLSVCDVLLTDASSCMFDFALTKAPCFLFFPDLEFYKNSERGFYREIEELPFPCSTTFEGLCESILAFDKSVYENKIDALLGDFGFVDDKDSSKRVAEYIISWCKK